MTWRLAVDIGGTFTDVVLAGGPAERQIIGKVLTTSKDPAAGVMDGIRQVLRRAASRARCTAGIKSPTSMPMMAITTSSSTSVNPATWPAAGRRDARAE